MDRTVLPTWIVRLLSSVEAGRLQPNPLFRGEEVLPVANE